MLATLAAGQTKESGKTEYMKRLEANEDHRGTKESICKMMEESGFRISNVIEKSFQMRYLDGSALLRHWLTRLGFIDGWRASPRS